MSRNRFHRIDFKIPNLTIEQRKKINRFLLYLTDKGINEGTIIHEEKEYKVHIHHQGDFDSIAWENTPNYIKDNIVHSDK